MGLQGDADLDKDPHRTVGRLQKRMEDLRQSQHGRPASGLPDSVEFSRMSRREGASTGPELWGRKIIETTGDALSMRARDLRSTVHVRNERCQTFPGRADEVTSIACRT